MKTLLKSLIVIVVVCVGLILSLPSLVSTSWGSQKLISIINNQIPGTLTIKSVNISWFGSQKVEDFELKDPNGNSVLKFAKFSTNTSLWKLFSSQPNLGKAELAQLRAMIVQENGITNVQRALIENPTIPPTEKHDDIHIKLPFKG